MAHKISSGQHIYFQRPERNPPEKKNQTLNIKIFSLQQKKSEIAGEKSEERSERGEAKKKKKLKLNHVANVEEIKLNEN